MGKYFLMCTLSSSCQAKRGDFSSEKKWRGGTKNWELRTGNREQQHKWHLYRHAPAPPKTRRWKPSSSSPLSAPLPFGIVQMLSHLSAGTNLHKRTLASGRMTYGCPARSPEPEAPRKTKNQQPPGPASVGPLISRSKYFSLKLAVKCQQSRNPLESMRDTLICPPKSRDYHGIICHVVGIIY